MDALSGRLPASRLPGEDAEARAILDRRSSRAELRLLRPQWRGRRCRRRCNHRHAEAGPADSRALAARRRIHLRAENAGDDRQGPRTARRGRQAHRLDAGNLESHAQSASRRGRKSARRPCFARSAARAAAKRRAGGQWRRRHAQWRAALQHSRQAHAPSSGDRSAGTHLGAARTRRNVQRIRARMLHR